MSNAESFSTVAREYPNFRPGYHRRCSAVLAAGWPAKDASVPIRLALGLRVGKLAPAN